MVLVDSETILLWSMLANFYALLDRKCNGHVSPFL